MCTHKYIKIFIYLISGRGSGSFVGGLLISTVGTRKSFRIMGLIAIGGGFSYFLLHYLWLRNLRVVKELEAQYKAGMKRCSCAEQWIDISFNSMCSAAEMAEKERQIKRKKGPMMKDVAISTERLSLMIEFYNRGSIRSLERSVNQLSRGSASKVDMLKAQDEIRRFSNPSVQLKNSMPNLRRQDVIGKEKVRLILTVMLIFFISNNTS